MTDPYIRALRAQRLRLLALRAAVLERQGVQTTLIVAREFGTADHAQRASAVRRGQTLDRASRRLMQLAWIVAALLGLFWLLRR